MTRLRHCASKICFGYRMEGTGGYVADHDGMDAEDVGGKWSPEAGKRDVSLILHAHNHSCHFTAQFKPALRAHWRGKEGLVREGKMQWLHRILVTKRPDFTDHMPKGQTPENCIRTHQKGRRSQDRRPHIFSCARGPGRRRQARQFHATTGARTAGSARLDQLSRCRLRPTRRWRNIRMSLMLICLVLVGLEPA